MLAKSLKFYFRNLLKIKTKPMCYIICGFIGAGKSTYSRQLAQATGAVHLNVDEWCMKLFSKDEYERNWGICFSKTVDYLWEKAYQYAQTKQSVIFDMGFWTKESRKNAFEKARKLGFVPQVYYIYAPDVVLKERILKRGGLWAEYTFNNFDHIKQQVDEPNISEKYIKIENF